MALNALGYSMNTKSDKELNAARKLLRSVKPYVSTINEVYLDDFSAGKIDLGITYSGDGLRAQAARKAKNDIRVVLPTGRLRAVDRQLGDLGLRAAPQGRTRVDQLRAAAEGQRGRDALRLLRGADTGFIRERGRGGQEPEDRVPEAGVQGLRDPARRRPTDSRSACKIWDQFKAS